MGEITYSFRVDAELKSAFDATARSQDISADDLLRDLMREVVGREHAAREHDEWFRAEAEEAVREADDPDTPWIPHEDVMARLETVMDFGWRLR